MSHRLSYSNKRFFLADKIIILSLLNVTFYCVLQLDYIYRGQAEVAPNLLEPFLALARSLGLAGFCPE